jgi:hypothetical protein
MSLSYKNRRRLALLILLVGLPAYIIVSISVVNWLERPSIWIELLVYLGLGLIWAVPLKSIFKGIGQADPDA